MNNTNLVFVVGSGRCGTKMIKKLLLGVPHIEARHEYVRNAYQREAMMYYLGKLPFSQMASQLQDIYGSAAHYSEAKIFLDSSHKLAWCVDVLADTFPEAKFIHLVRDGRRVVSSFFYKLNIFDDHGANALRDWLERREWILPPRTENYWQIPAPGYDRFQRICLHWVASNLSIMKGLTPLPDNRKLFIRLEELVESKDEMKRLLSFLDTEYNDSFHEAMQKKDHVYVPVDYSLTQEQNEQFDEICGEMMKILGYEGKDE